MTKLILNNVGDLRNTTTAENTINTNSNTLEVSFENTLSRDGTEPNHMLFELDMNSNQIINLPEPNTINSPVRVQDLNALTPSIVNVNITDFTYTTITGGAHTYASPADSFKVISRSNSGSNMIDILPGTGSPGGVLPANTQIVIYNADSSLLAVTAGSGASLDGGIPLYLGYKQKAVIFSNGSNYFTISRPDYAKLGNNNTFYINSTTGSDNNHGLTSGVPLATLAGGYNLLKSRFDLDNLKITFQVAAGTYSEISAQGPVRGIKDTTSIVFNGDTTTPSNVVISNNVNSLVAAGSGAQFTLQGFKLLNLGGGFCIVSTDPGTNVSVKNLDFPAGAGTTHMYATGYGRITVIGNYNITGATAGSYHMYAVVGGFIDAEGAYTYTITGSPAFDTFAYSRFAALIDHKLANFSGSCTGKRYAVDSHGMIHTQSGNAHYFPGNAEGTNTDGTGYYD